ncbi:MAG: GspE/PulE family protein [Candidatus Omnitrophica bacterium]|nr:GspE/PulE family protein [Candidatus Omnitrophota bacterium]MCM8831822.1 GspE/PulE family protein [Candidatus Omnitrophota bacterium]
MEKFASEDKFYFLCEKTIFPPIDLTKYQIPVEIIKYIPQHIAKAYCVVPLSKADFVLTVVIADPQNIVLIDNLKIITGLEISLVIAPRQQILDAISKYYSFSEKEYAVDTVTKVSSKKDFSEEIKINLDAIKKDSEKKEIINLVNTTLKEAVEKRASDIHIELWEDKVSLRYRIDGILQKVKEIEKKYQEAIIVRIKLLSRLDITQKRIPQDGRFSFHFQSRDIEVRVSTLPTIFGEKIVMRLLDKENVKLNMENLGFSPYALEIFKKAISKPFGMILLTGPTGSGKTTTLYSILNYLNDITKNIITIEDPVEYNLPGISQVPVRSEIGLGFATILRAILRQSPDIIMVGEIRDIETADIAMKAALTGHIVLSTLHTNDAPSAIVRLLNMGIEPFLISSALNMIAAQRLVRKICFYCKKAYTLDLGSYNEIPPIYRQKEVVLYKGEGCLKCENTGYKGRVAVTEVFYLDDTLKEMIIKGASVDEMKKYASLNCGMKTLREDAFEKCLKGETTLEELIRVTLT